MRNEWLLWFCSWERPYQPLPVQQDWTAHFWADCCQPALSGTAWRSVCRMLGRASKMTHWRCVPVLLLKAGQPFFASKVLLGFYEDQFTWEQSWKFHPFEANTSVLESFDHFFIGARLKVKRKLSLWILPATRIFALRRLTSDTLRQTHCRKLCWVQGLILRHFYAGHGHFTCWPQSYFLGKGGWHYRVCCATRLQVMLLAPEGGRQYMDWNHKKRSHFHASPKSLHTWMTNKKEEKQHASRSFVRANWIWGSTSFKRKQRCSCCASKGWGNKHSNCCYSYVLWGGQVDARHPILLVTSCFETSSGGRTFWRWKSCSRRAAAAALPPPPEMPKCNRAYPKSGASPFRPSHSPAGSPVRAGEVLVATATLHGYSTLVISLLRTNCPYFYSD